MTIPSPGMEELIGEISVGYERTAKDQVRMARRVTTILAILAIIGFVVIFLIDWYVFSTSGVSILDDTVSAEAAAIGAVIVVVGGIVATWTYLQPDTTGN
jgi:uncharacterized membrane protein